MMVFRAFERYSMSLSLYNYFVLQACECAIQGLRSGQHSYFSIYLCGTSDKLIHICFAKISYEFGKVLDATYWRELHNG
jgi:hypothetical protein